MKTFYFFLLLSAAFFCGEKLGAQTPTTDTPPTFYRFEEEKLPSASPCATCVGFSATQKYKAGNLLWSLCSSSTARGYLDLKLTKSGQPDFTVRLLRDCANPASIKVLRCAGNDAYRLIIVKLSDGEGGYTDDQEVESTTLKVALASGGGSILTVRVATGSQVEINLKPAWALWSGRKACP